jgi:TolA-binding protein
MQFDRRFPATAIVCLASSIAGVGTAAAQAPAPGAPATLDMQMMQEAAGLSDKGDFAAAAAKYDEMVKKFPQVPSVPQANFLGGQAYFRAGNYDAAITDFKKVTEAKNLPAELAPLVELATSLIPQALSAKAAKMAPEDQRKKATQEEAVKQFDAFLTKFPNSEEVESANYGKAVTLFQLNRFDESVTALRANLTKFAQSPSVQDSQYLLGLTLAAQASAGKQKPTPDPAADAQFDEGEKLLRDIITKRQNIALMNDAQFQIGELLLARAGFMEKPEEKDKRNETFNKALDAFRSVAGKDAVMAAQQARIQQFSDLRTKYGTAHDVTNFQRFNRLVDKAKDRLEEIKQGPDMTLQAKLKTGVIYFSQNKWDEVRVFYSQMENLGVLEDANDKKQAAYFVALSYATQDILDKAVEKYDAFMGAYHADPLAENLPLAVGAIFLSDKSGKAKDPDKAIHYFSEGIKMYPKGKLLGAMVLARAGAQIELQKYDEATAALKDTLSKNPPKELAVDAEFYLATIYAKTGKQADSVKQFKDVRDKFPGTPQAEQAHFQIGQILSEIDAKGAIPELQSFFTKFPKSPYMPAALFALGKSQAATNQNADALNTFKKVATDFPKSDPAPYTYFERAKILLADQKFDECLAMMRDFIKTYPESPALFQAYDFIAQIQTSKGKGGTEAIDTYEEFVKKRPKDASTPEALLKIAVLWKAFSDSQGSYLAMGEGPKREDWKKGLKNSNEAAEKLLLEFPDSQQVAKALNTIMDVQRAQQSVKLKTEADIEKYFNDLAEKFAGKPGTRAKILFSLAALTFDKDKAKAVEQMKKAYDPKLKFAPEDLDLYGTALIESKQYDEAIKIYEKIASDYKFTGDPKLAPREVQEATAISIAGQGKAYQAKGDPASKQKAAKLFDELEKNYPWSPKMLEVNYGIAVAMHDKHTEHDDEEAIKRIQEVIKAQKATPELRAKSMLLLGDIHRDAGRIPLAIDNYIKISVFYTGVPKVAAEGLWRGAQLLEDQSTGKYPMPTPTPTPPKSAATPKTAGTPKPGGAPKAATPKK